MITVKSFEVNYFSENTYILHDESREAVMIDCGCLLPQEEKEIADYITENQLTLKHYLCTHLHLDHVFGNGFIYKTYGIRPQAHKADVEILPTADEQARMFNLPKHIEDIKVEKFLHDGESILFGNSELTAILVPGHSPGSLAYYNKKNGYLFSGDALFAGSIGRTDLWGGNMDILVSAIKDKLLTLPDETIVYPGHGPETTIFAEKRGNPYL